MEELIIKNAVLEERERWTSRMVELWHSGEGKSMSLREFMGMTEQEYEEWLKIDLESGETADAPE